MFQLTLTDFSVPLKSKRRFEMTSMSTLCQQKFPLSISDQPAGSSDSLPPIQSTMMEGFVVMYICTMVMVTHHHSVYGNAQSWNSECGFICQVYRDTHWLAQQVCTSLLLVQTFSFANTRWTKNCLCSIKYVGNRRAMACTVYMLLNREPMK